MEHKYIVMALGDNETIFVFPKVVDHDRMVEACAYIRFGGDHGWSRKYKEGQVISAGFISSKGECYGHSETLGLKSRGAVDTELFQGQSRG